MGKEKKLIRPNSARAWVLAARPKTLTGAAVPVMIGLSIAFVESGGTVRAVPALLCFLFAFVMQIDANFVNDYFDFRRGNDGEDRLGPLRACTQGWISPSAMRGALLLTTGVACLIGLPLVFYGGWPMVAVGAFCVVFCFLYTTHLSYVGMGDLLVLLFFGVVPVTMTCFLALPEGAQRVSPECLLASLACGLVIDTLLVVNNYRDIDNDRGAGKRTLIVLIGSRGGRLLYLLLGLTACLLGAFFLLNGHGLATLLPILGYLPLHFKAYSELCRIGKGRALNSVLGMTARNILVYGTLVSLGLLLEAVPHFF